jgi:hypothetical protein
MLQLCLEAVAFVFALQFNAGAVAIAWLRQVSKVERFGDEDANGDADLLYGKREQKREPHARLHELRG